MPVRPRLVLLAALALLTLLAGRARRRRPPESDAFTDDVEVDLVACGAVDAHGVRLWWRTRTPGRHVVEVVDDGGRVERAEVQVPGDPALDGTFAIRWPDDVGRPPLRPDHPYRFRVRRPDGAEVGAGRFRTAPATAADLDAVSIGTVSCHQPFDDDGRLSGRHLTLLPTLPDLFEAERVRVLMMMGDQMYADLPCSRSLFAAGWFRRVAPPGRRTLLDCTREEVRSLFHARYRTFFAEPSFARLRASFPVVCTLDDHEVVDNFGSDPAHATEDWAAVRAGALDAFHDYQGLLGHPRPRPTSFPTRFGWGPVAGLMLDLRSQRVADDARIRVLGEDQWALLSRFLDEERDRPVVVLGLSVPLLHAPAWVEHVGGTVAKEGSNVDDRWSHPKAVGERDRLVHLLHAHRRRRPGQHLVLVSGDVHVGTLSEIRFDDAPPILQLVSSAVSNLERRAWRSASDALARAEGELVTREGLRARSRLLGGAERGVNPCGALNAGLITARARGGAWTVRLRLVSHAGDPPRATVVADSGEIEAEAVLRRA